MEDKLGHPVRAVHEALNIGASELVQRPDKAGNLQADTALSVYSTPQQMSRRSPVSRGRTFGEVEDVRQRCLAERFYKMQEASPRNPVFWQ